MSITKIGINLFKFFYVITLIVAGILFLTFVGSIIGDSSSVFAYTSNRVVDYINNILLLFELIIEALVYLTIFKLLKNLILNGAYRLYNEAITHCLSIKQFAVAGFISSLIQVILYYLFKEEGFNVEQIPLAGATITDFLVVDLTGSSYFILYVLSALLMGFLQKYSSMEKEINLTI